MAANTTAGSMSAVTELLPCPFCGGEARSYDFDTQTKGQLVWRYVVTCGGEQCAVEPWFDRLTLDEAIKAWNTRAALEAALAALGVGSEAEDAASVEFEIWQDDPHDFAPLMVASVAGPRGDAWADALHYARQYADDGPIRIDEVTRRDVTPPGYAARTASPSGDGEG